MNTLWVRLSIAFGTVVVLSTVVLISLSIFVAQQGEPVLLPHIIFDATQTLAEELSASYALHGSWVEAEILIDQALSELPPTPQAYVQLFNADHQPVAGSAPPEPQLATHIPLIIDDQLRGALALTLLPPQFDQTGFIFQELSRLILLVAVVGAVLGLVFGVLISRSLTAPLAQLSAAAQAFGSRDWQHHVPLHGSTEIKAVASAFNTMAQQLASAEQLRRNLHADVAHELRTPLSVLQGNLRAMLDHVYAIDEAEIARLYEQTRILSRLVADLHDVAQAEAQQLPLYKQHIAFTALLETGLDAVRPLAEESQIEIELHTPAEELFVYGDRVRLMQVLHNLLLNALQHTPAGGTITCDVVQQHTELVITLADTGSGIDPHHVPFIFDRFYRVDKQRSRAKGGSGLGLAIVRALIQAHGGSISACSDGSSGTRMIWRMPASHGSLP